MSILKEINESYRTNHTDNEDEQKVSEEEHEAKKSSSLEDQMDKEKAEQMERAKKHTERWYGGTRKELRFLNKEERAAALKKRTEHMAKQKKHREKLKAAGTYDGD